MFCYIHIPFCQSRCKYCRFSTFSWKNDLDKKNYVDYLVKVIEEYKNINKPLNSIYFWWWTPTSLDNKQLEIIIWALSKKFGFNKDIEISLETKINNITEENLLYWNSLWINRISLWIQTLNNQSLKEIWRQCKEEIINKLDIIKEHLKTPPTHDVRFSPHLRGNKGDLNLTISLDFIIWLPYVKKWEVLQDIKYIIKSYDFVKHISLYMLEEYYDYPKKWQKLSINEEDFLEEYINCKNYLEKKGFNRYELSNFAKPEFECKHNRAYWDHSDVVAFWLWAHWFIQNTRYAYPNNFKDYYSWIIEYKERLTLDDLFLEKVMFSLRTNWLWEELYEKFDQKKIKYFIKENLLNFQDNKLILCNNWVTLIDYIIKEII